jgi:site-specific DNA-methyltransferase (adenine-specific)
MAEINFYNIDCIELMKTKPDNHYDLAIVDPPYGIGASNYQRGGTRYGNSAAICKTYTKKDWDNEPPSKEYFDELFRVSKNQIIWGANHFISRMPYDSSCWIVWDKMTAPGSGYADCELAWTSFDKAVRQFRIQWSGMLQYNMKEKEERIHPTQKPIPLYGKILQKFAEQGMKILDTHGGSMTIAIACDKLNFDLDVCEIDEEYFNNGKKKFNEHKCKPTLF